MRCLGGLNVWPWACWVQTSADSLARSGLALEDTKTSSNWSQHSTENQCALSSCQETSGLEHCLNRGLHVMCCSSVVDSVLVSRCLGLERVVKISFACSEEIIIDIDSKVSDYSVLVMPGCPMFIMKCLPLGNETGT